MNLPASGAAAALGPTAQERKDVERFVKFLAHKMVQVVVQSRLGEKASTPCRQLPSSGDWFNLAVDDIAEVAAETRKALDGRIPQPGGPALHVEISLRTVEGDQLVLEDWSLSASQAAEPQGRVTYTVYSRMSLLLKSIITVSRITPAYKLSGRQGADTFVLCYRVHTGRPRDLGEQPQSRVLGRVDTPIGDYSVQLDYRTLLTLQPKDGLQMLVKSDHFTPEPSPRLCRQQQQHQQQSSSGSSDQAATSDESQDACRLFVNSPPTMNRMAESVPSDDVATPSRPSGSAAAPTGPLWGAFAEPPPAERRAEFALPELPLPTFMKMQQQALQALHKVEASTAAADKKDAIAEVVDLAPSNISEDFVMVESLKTPFADGEAGAHVGDVGAFFRECQSAPLSLASFRGGGAAGAAAAGAAPAAPEIGCQLQQFEKDAEDYDLLLKALCIDQPDAVASSPPCK